MLVYARLYELGKVDLAYAGTLARYAVAQTHEGRVVGSGLNARDISSPYAQSKNRLTLQRPDHYDKIEDCGQEILVQDRRFGPFDIARTKLDFRAWLRSLPVRLRRIVRFLAGGETTSATATKFGLTPGRISQIRSELAASWSKFVGEELIAA